jgi:hypothetical protein
LPNSVFATQAVYEFVGKAVRYQAAVIALSDQFPSFVIKPVRILISAELDL